MYPNDAVPISSLQGTPPTVCLFQRLPPSLDRGMVASKIIFLVGSQESLLVTVRRMKLAWFGHLTRHDSLSKPFFRESWRVSDAVVGRENAGWTAPTNGHPCPFQICSQGPPAEKTGRGFLLNRSSCFPDDPISHEKGLN